MTATHLFSTLDAGGYAILRVFLSILWQSTILLAAAGALAWILRKRGDAVRHAIWTAAVLAFPLLPLLSLGAEKNDSPPERVNKETAKMSRGITIEPIDKEGILRLIPDEEINGGPAFVKQDIPHPFSHIELYYFHIPATARVRVEVCNQDDKVVSELKNEQMQKGVYKLSIARAFLRESWK